MVVRDGDVEEVETISCRAVWDNAKGWWYGKVVWVQGMRLWHGFRLWTAVCDGGMADAMRSWSQVSPIGAADRWYGMIM